MSIQRFIGAAVVVAMLFSLTAFGHDAEPPAGAAAQGQPQPVQPQGNPQPQPTPPTPQPAGQQQQLGVNVSPQQTTGTAQQTNTQSTTTTSAQQQPPAPPPADLSIRILKGSAAPIGDPVARLGDAIELTGTNLGTDAKTATLYLNGRDTGLRPIEIGSDSAVYRLERTADNKSLWSELLYSPLATPRRPVTASIGTPTRTSPAAVPAAEAQSPKWKPAAFTLQVFEMKWYGWFWLLLLAAIIVSLFRLARDKDILRDGPRTTGTTTVIRPYSLGRTQMAFWFVLILIGYIFIWLTSGDQDTITPSLLTLMGISALTALASSMINDNAGVTDSNERTRLLAEAVAVDDYIQMKQTQMRAADPTANAATLTMLQSEVTKAGARRQEVQDRLAELNTPPTSKGWLTDILSDSTGTIVLHRFQIAVWTLVLGIMFAVAVVTRLTMPTFNETLLALMGISAGTYLGFKFPEK